MTPILATALAAALLLSSGGSDAPTPYTVDPTGITLPAGVTFPDNGHVNIRTSAGVTLNLHFESKCINRTDAECAGPRHAAAQFIGASFIPWTAFGLSPTDCVAWTQLSDYPEHYGEGGQPPICLTPPVTPPTEPPVVVPPTEPPVVVPPVTQPPVEAPPTPVPPATVTPDPEPTHTPPALAATGAPWMNFGAAGVLLLAAGVAALVLRRSAA